MSQVQGRLPHQNVEIFKGHCFGQGSFGVIYKAQCDLLPCAAKTIRSDILNASDDPKEDAIEKIERMFEQLSQLRHPNIVQCLGVHRDNLTGLPILLMELAPENLTMFLQRNSLLSNCVHVDISYDVTLALYYLHSNDIVHGNLSSNNILIFRSHRAKVTDVDSPVIPSKNRSFQNDDPNDDASVYMPPEVFRGSGSKCEKVDIFSLGVVQTQVITGEFPKHMASKEHIYTGVQQIDRSHPLLSIVTECLKHSKNERPSSQDLVTQLASLKEQAETQSSSPRESLSVVHCQTPDTLPVAGRSPPLHHSHHCAGHTSEEDAWLPVHVQVTGMDSGKCGKGNKIVDGEESMVDSGEFEKDEEKSNLSCNGHILTILGEGKEEGKIDLCREGGVVHGTDQKVLEALRHTIEKTNAALMEREAEIEEVKREKCELSTNLQHLQKEMLAMKTKNRRLEQELATKEKELQQLKLSQQTDGGINGTHASTLSAMSWRKGSDAPFSGKLGSATALGNLVCVRVAGSSEIHVCDTASQEWFLAPPCPLDACSLVMVNSTLTAVGGRIDASVTNLLYSVHLKSFHAIKRQPWKEQLPPMLTKRMFAMAISSANVLAVAGGWNGHQALRTVEILRLDRDPMHWSRVSSLPSPVYSASACICKGKLYVLGGFTQKGPTKAVLSASISSLLDSTRDSVWHRPTSLPTYRSTCVTFNDHLLSFGGENDNELERKSSATSINDNSRETGAVYEYNTLDGEWYLISEMPTSRCQSCVAALSDRSEVMVVGGHSGSTGRTRTVQLATLEL